MVHMLFLCYIEDVENENVVEDDVVDDDQLQRTTTKTVTLKINL